MPRGEYDRAAAKARRVALQNTALAALNARPSDDDLKKIDMRIRSTFNVMGRIVEGMIRGDGARGLLCTGAPGIGKTHDIERALRSAVNRDKIKYNQVGGSMSAIGLYQELYDMREKNCILLLDDCDSVFYDTQTMNLLKHALDTKEVRTLSWIKESGVLREKDIPNSFDFMGSVIFISNLDMQREIDGQGKMAPHYNAVINRTTWVDMGIHTKWEILARIKQVVFSDEFIHLHKLEDGQVLEMIDWIEDNIGRVRSLSIRTMVQLARLMRNSGDFWEEDAEITLLKRA